MDVATAAVCDQRLGLVGDVLVVRRKEMPTDTIAGYG